MPHAFKIVSGFVRETRVIAGVTAPSGFVLASAGEFADVTNLGLIYKPGVYRWRYTGGSADSVSGQLVQQVRPEGARITRLDGDGFVMGGVAQIKADTAPAGHIMLSPADYSTLISAHIHVYPDGRKRFHITGGTRERATGTLIDRPDTRPTGEWSFEGDSSSNVIITRLVGVATADAVLTVTPAPRDGTKRTVHFGDGRTLALTFTGGRSRVPIPTATKATRGDGMMLSEARELRMLNTLTVQAIGDLDLE